ncbi:hypothetical protein FKM82_000627 [Ascaphus truei]
MEPVAAVALDGDCARATAATLRSPAPMSSARAGDLPRALSVEPPMSVIKMLAPCAMKYLPYFCKGEVVKGFGRGSKELGIPTANFPEHVVDNLPTDISTGIYYGWGCVDDGEVHKMVMSIGWNPFYKNTKKSVETHIIHQFKEDFYGEMLTIVVAGYIRPERSFDSLGKLHKCEVVWAAATWVL